jgi:Ala-tRNA(Pro) deacylase
MAIRDHLLSRRIPYEVVLHRPAPCASRLAECLHVPGRTVAKAVLLRAGGGYLLAVLPSTHRIDLSRLTEALGLEGLRLATEEEAVRIFHDCERGAIPPFGRLYGLTTLVDPSLAGSSVILIEGNMRHEVLRIRFRDFEAVEEPVRVRFAAEVAPRQRRLTRRRAG